VSRNAAGDCERTLSGAGLAGFLRSVGASATWQKLLAVQSLAIALAWIKLLDQPPATAAARDSGVTDPGALGLAVVTYSLALLLTFIAALCADEAVRRGAPPKLTYFGTLVTASLAVALVLPYVRGWLGLLALRYGTDRPNSLMEAIEVGFYGGFAMWIYLNRRSCRRMMEGVRNADRRRRQLERQLVNSHIASAQARIDPSTLFASLENIRNHLRDGTPDAEAELETLIQRLRAALRPVEAPETIRL
jgi:hypothetical protein